MGSESDLFPLGFENLAYSTMTIWWPQYVYPTIVKFSDCKYVMSNVEMPNIEMSNVEMSNGEIEP